MEGNVTKDGPLAHSAERMHVILLDRGLYVRISRIPPRNILGHRADGLDTLVQAIGNLGVRSLEKKWHVIIGCTQEPLEPIKEIPVRINVRGGDFCSGDISTPSWSLKSVHGADSRNIGGGPLSSIIQQKTPSLSHLTFDIWHEYGGNKTEPHGMLIPVEWRKTSCTSHVRWGGAAVAG